SFTLSTWFIFFIRVLTMLLRFVMRMMLLMGWLLLPVSMLFSIMMLMSCFMIMFSSVMMSCILVMFPVMVIPMVMHVRRFIIICPLFLKMCRMNGNTNFRFTNHFCNEFSFNANDKLLFTF